MVSANPPSRGRVFARVAFSLSMLSLLLLLAAGPGTRFGWWGFRFGLSLFRYSLYAGAAGFLASLSALLFLRSGAGKFRMAWIGFVVGFLITVNGAVWVYTAFQVPRIHDITTDTKNPPLFEAVLPLRLKALNSVTYGGPSVAAQQEKAYPEIQPLVVPQPLPKVWDACLEAAKSMGWKIDAAQEARGRLEATATTFWFGFKDDIVVRLLPEKVGSRVDVRSLSRVGLSDLGTNARRVREYLARVQADLG